MAELKWSVRQLAAAGLRGTYPPSKGSTVRIVPSISSFSVSWWYDTKSDSL